MSSGIYVGLTRKEKCIDRKVVVGELTLGRNLIWIGDKSFDTVIGPFKTMQGAEYMAGDGFLNTNCTNVTDAERFAATRSFAVLHEEIEAA